jgi:hypothetical protein
MPSSAESYARYKPNSRSSDAHRLRTALEARPDHVLDEEYYRDSIAIADRQASIRLARVLNEALECPPVRVP